MIVRSLYRDRQEVNYILKLLSLTMILLLLLTLVSEYYEVMDVLQEVVLNYSGSSSSVAVIFRVDIQVWKTSLWLV